MSIHRLPVADRAEQPNSPISPSYPLGLTHAGGIQPAASFFRPSRPNFQPQYSRPSSQASTRDNHHPDGGLFQMQSMNRSEEDGLGGADIQDRFGSLKRQKQSREPLLPLTTSSGMTTPTTPVAIHPKHRTVRSSLDRVINLSRGLSFDSIRRSTSIRHTPPAVTTTNPLPPPIPLPFEAKMPAIGHDDDDRHHSHYDDEHRPYSPTTPKKRLHHRSLEVRTVDRRHSTALSCSVPPTSPSPDPSFVPTPPILNPALSATPLINPSTHKPYRRYQLHPSRNRFFLNGHLLTGGDTPWAFIGSFSLVIGIAAVWFSTTAVWWWRNVSPAVAAVGAYMALLTVSTMLATALVDPGILPRGLDPDPPYPASSPSDGGVRAPMPRDLKVRSDTVRVKYCPTCKTYRPPRSSHCKMCDNCVDGCDHHCQWVNNCIGRRNYTTFFALLVSATLTIVLIIVTSALHLFLLTQREDIGFGKALGRGVGSAVAFSLCIAVFWPVAALLTYHMRLLLLNITTIEQIRNQAHKSLVPGPPPPNPFSHGSWRKNIFAVLCRPVGFSWLDPSGIVTEDRREVNPGVYGGKEGMGGDEVWDGSQGMGGAVGSGPMQVRLHGHGRRNES